MVRGIRLTQIAGLIRILRAEIQLHARALESQLSTFARRGRVHHRTVCTLLVLFVILIKAEVVVTLRAARLGLLILVRCNRAQRVPAIAVGRNVLLIVDRRRGDKVNGMGSRFFPLLAQRNLQRLNTLHRLCQRVGQALVYTDFCRAIQCLILRYVVDLRGRPASLTQVDIFRADLQRYAKVNNKGVFIIEGVIQIDLFTSRCAGFCIARTARYFNAGIITVKVLCAERRQRRQVSRNRLYISLQVRHFAIHERTLPSIFIQADIRVKVCSLLNSNIVGIELPIGRLVDVVHRQGILSNLCTDIVGNLHGLLTVNLNAGHNRFAANAIGKRTGNAGIGSETTRVQIFLCICPGNRFCSLIFVAVIACCR